MIIASCVAVIHVPDARSLKDKRSVLRGLIRRLRDRHNVSVIEVDGQDLWQKGVLGIALAARDRVEAEARLQRIQRDIEETTGLKRIDFQVELL